VSLVALAALEGIKAFLGMDTDLFLPNMHYIESLESLEMFMLIKLAQSTPGTFSLPGPLLIVLCRARLARLLASKRKRMQVCITRVGGMRAKNQWFTRR